LKKALKIAENKRNIFQNKFSSARCFRNFSAIGL